MLTRHKVKGTEKLASDLKVDANDVNKDINLLLSSNEIVQPVNDDPQPSTENCKTVESIHSNNLPIELTPSDDEAIEGLDKFCKALWDKANVKAAKKLKIAKRISLKKEVHAKKEPTMKYKKKKVEEEYKQMRMPLPPQQMVYTQYMPAMMDYSSMMMYNTFQMMPNEFAVENQQYKAAVCPNLSATNISRPINFPKGAIHAAIAYHIFNKVKQEMAKDQQKPLFKPTP